MKNSNHFYRSITIILLLLSSLTLTAQRHYYPGRWPGHYHPYRYFSPGFSTHFGPGSFGYGPYRYNPYYYGRNSIGLTLSVLPFGYSTFYLGPVPFYYYGGTYYRSYGNNNYQVVAPPVGAKIPELPAGAKAEIINGQKYYEYNGTYYRQTTNDTGEVLYEVIGKNSVLNKDGSNSSATPYITDDTEKVGDETDRLPGNGRTIVINQQKYYESPSGYYYQEIIKDNKVSYKIVGNVKDGQ